MAALSDPIADFITRIRNAGKAQHRFVDIPWSKVKENIANILKNYGFIENLLVKHDTPQRGTMRIFLKYTDARKPVIQGLQRVSKPGLRKYLGHHDIPRFYGGFGLSILSTSQGIMAGYEANNLKIGGEILCLVW